MKPGYESDWTKFEKKTQARHRKIAKQATGDDHEAFEAAHAGLAHLYSNPIQDNMSDHELRTLQTARAILRDLLNAMEARGGE